MDFRGEVKVLLHNTDDFKHTVNKGDRIAQGVINEVVKVHFNLVPRLSDTERGEGGFGSTGIKS